MSKVCVSETEVENQWEDYAGNRTQVLSLRRKALYPCTTTTAHPTWNLPKWSPTIMDVAVMVNVKLGSKFSKKIW